MDHDFSCFLTSTFAVSHTVAMKFSFQFLASPSFLTNKQAMVHYLLLPFVITILLINHAAYSLPEGAPVYACGTMTPGHFRFAQTTTSPFTATLSSVIFTLFNFLLFLILKNISYDFRVTK